MHSPPPGDSPAAHRAGMHMDHICIDTWRTMHDHDARAGCSVEMHQRSAYLEALEDTARAQQPRATLRHNRAGNRSIAATSRSLHTAHCAGSVWRAHQEVAYPQHHDPLYMHYHRNSATPEIVETAARDHRTQRRVFELKLQHLAQMVLDMYNALLGPATYDTLARMDMRCRAELQSFDSEVSASNVVPVPAELMAA